MKVKIFILLASVFFIVSCKTDKKKIRVQNKLIVKSKIEPKIDTNLEKKDSIRTKNNLTLDYLQGMWTSYSYYLENEKENKDFHKNKYYKIVNGKKSLEIILKRHDLDNIIIQTNILGFIDENKNNAKVSNLKNEGRFFVKVKLSTKNINDNTTIKINRHEISQNFESYFDTNEIFDDYLDYQFPNDTIIEKVTFTKLFTLPEAVYKRLIKSKNDYLNEFNIKGFSKKIKVVVNKTYFYNDEVLQNKRKAFLVKGDVAYLEEEGENYVKVYFNGKSAVTSGYLKLVDIEILK